MTSQDALTDRYGAPTPWQRRTVIVLCVLLAAGFLGWLAWVTYDHANPAVDSDLETFEVQGEHAVTARMLIRLRDADVEATCLLRAFAEDHTVVGELSFTPEYAEGEHVERTVRTERRATSVDLIGCTAPGQPRAR